MSTTTSPRSQPSKHAGPNDPAQSPQLNQPSGGNRVAFGISLLCHLGALGLLAFLMSTAGSGTTEVPQSRSVGMAVVHRLPDRTRYVTTPEKSVPQTSPKSETNSQKQKQATDQAAESKKSQSPPPLAKEVANEASDAPFDLESVIAALDSGLPTNPLGAAAKKGTADGEVGVRESVNPQDLVAGRIRTGDGRSIDQLEDSELIPGRARAGLGAGRTTTQVFGVSGTGSTFVYVFDRSESMRAAGGAPLRALKSELIRSLDTLTERQQFQIIFYNDKADVFKPFGDRVGLVTGDEGTIVRAKEFVQRTTAIGGTEHSIALKMAMRLAPDVVFFLTDAKIQTMSDAELDEIGRRAESAGTTVHGIQFGTGPQPASSFVKQLAKRNRGGYRYLDVTDL